MFDVTLSIGLGPVKDPVIYEWADVSKLQIVTEIERRLLEGLLKLGALSTAILDGSMPTATTTNPIEMVIEFLVMEDGEKWHRTVLEYPKMGEEQQVMFLGMLAGEMSSMSREVRGKAKAKKGKAVGKGR